MRLIVGDVFDGFEERSGICRYVRGHGVDQSKEVYHANKTLHSCSALHYIISSDVMVYFRAHIHKAKLNHSARSCDHRQIYDSKAIFDTVVAREFASQLRDGSNDIAFFVL